MFSMSRKLDDTYLIAYHYHKIYAAGIKDGYLVIYRKDVFDAGEWDLLCNLELKFSMESKCQNCHNCMPIAAGIIESKLWILSVGELNEENIRRPHVFSIDLDTKELNEYRTMISNSDFLNDICISCHGLQITKEDDANGMPRFLVLPLCPNAPRKYDFMTISSRTPFWKQFYFTVDEENLICKIQEVDRIFMNSKSLYKVFLDHGQLLFNLQRESFNGLEEDISFNFKVLDFLESTTQRFMGYFRDGNTKFYCLTVDEFEDDTSKINLYKIGFNFTLQTARFYHLNSFHVTGFLPDIPNSQIFIDSNILLYLSPFGIVTLTNRMLTLSECAYMALRKLSDIVVKKTGMRLEINCPGTYYNGQDGAYMSMKFLHDVIGIPKNVFIQHGSKTK